MIKIKPRQDTHNNILVSLHMDRHDVEALEYAYDNAKKQLPMAMTGADAWHGLLLEQHAKEVHDELRRYVNRIHQHNFTLTLKPSEVLAMWQLWKCTFALAPWGGLAVRNLIAAIHKTSADNHMVLPERIEQHEQIR